MGPIHPSQDSPSLKAPETHNFLYPTTQEKPQP